MGNATIKATTKELKNVLTELSVPQSTVTLSQICMSSLKSMTEEGENIELSPHELAAARELVPTTIAKLVEQLTEIIQLLRQNKVDLE